MTEPTLEQQYRSGLPDPIRRAVRTFIQAVFGVIVIQAGALAMDAEDGVIDVDLWRRVLITAIVAGVIALVTWVYNGIESVTGKSLLK